MYALCRFRTRRTPLPSGLGCHPLLCSMCPLRAIDILRTSIHSRQQLCSFEPPECRFGHLQNLPDYGCRVLNFLEPLGSCGS